MGTPDLDRATTVPAKEALRALMGLAIFGERIAARTYVAMAELRAEHRDLLRRFAAMEAGHGTSFAQASAANGVEPDRAFAERELGYLTDQVDEYAGAGDFDALAVLQGFIVESLAIATYEPFLTVAPRFPGTGAAFAQALDDERYHVEWIVRYFRLRYFDGEDELVTLAARVNQRGVDCVGGTMMNIARHLDTIGMSGADCAAGMMDGYAGLLERVGLEQRAALRNVLGLFAPLMTKYRRGERTK